MKSHTTNYFNTFIEVADDTKTNCGTPPPSKDRKTVAEMQYELISKNPYKYTSDDILFQIYADRNDLMKTEYKQAKQGLNWMREKGVIPDGWGEVIEKTEKEKSKK